MAFPFLWPHPTPTFHELIKLPVSVCLPLLSLSLSLSLCVSVCLSVCLSSWRVCTSIYGTMPAGFHHVRQLENIYRADPNRKYPYPALSLPCYRFQHQRQCQYVMLTVLCPVRLMQGCKEGEGGGGGGGYPPVRSCRKTQFLQSCGHRYTLFR